MLGNIDQLPKSITDLNLAYTNVEGEARHTSNTLWADSQMLPQGNTQKNFRGMCFICPQPSLHTTHGTTAGDISALAGAPIGKLILCNCESLTGTLFLSGCSNLEMLPQGNTSKSLSKNVINKLHEPILSVTYIPHTHFHFS